MKVPWLSQGEQFSVGALFTFLAALLILSSLYGCASTFDYQWVKVREAIPLDRRTTLYMKASEVEAACGKQPRVSVHTITNTVACAKVSIALNWCYLILPFGAPQWMIVHENRHCDGEDHDKFDPVMGLRAR